MSKFQFLRFETFGLRARKSQLPHRCIAGVTDEAIRKRNSCNHVASVRSETIFGEPVAAAEIAAEQAKRAVDRRGCRWREDAAALIVAVASYPVSSQDVMQDPDEYQTYIDWREATLSWFQHKFCETLKAVVEHRDEAYFHLHVFIVPALIGQKLDFQLAHPGIAAQEVAFPCKANQILRFGDEIPPR